MTPPRHVPPPPRLWHFTCAHARDLIDGQGVLLPNVHPVWPRPLVWLTDLEDAPPEVLFGHPTGRLKCDRSEYRYEVEDVHNALPWTVYARRMPWHIRDAYESVPGVLCRHWWVSEFPLPVVASALAVNL